MEVYYTRVLSEAESELDDNRGNGTIIYPVTPGYFSADRCATVGEMSNFLISFLAAVGISGWIYSQMRRRTNITQTALLIAGVSGLGLFIVFLVLFSVFLPE